MSRKVRIPKVVEYKALQKVDESRVHFAYNLIFTKAAARIREQQKATSDGIGPKKKTMLC